MAKARTLDKRRNSVRNIRKITRTMELIANARFRKASDRALAIGPYSDRISQLVTHICHSGLNIPHPLLDQRPRTRRAVFLVLTANRGMCGAYNSSMLRLCLQHLAQLRQIASEVRLEVSGKRGIAALKHRQIPPEQEYTHFSDEPRVADVETLATQYLEEFRSQQIDRLDVAYVKFLHMARQEPVVETLLPLGADSQNDPNHTDSPYELLPSAESIVDEVVPASFRIKLLKCFLDAAVSEHIARMVAMKAATENADEMIRHLSMTYNRARQSQITGEIMEIIGGVEALQS